MSSLQTLKQLDISQTHSTIRRCCRGLFSGLFSMRHCSDAYGFKLSVVDLLDELPTLATGWRSWRRGKWILSCFSQGYFSEIVNCLVAVFPRRHQRTRIYEQGEHSVSKTLAVVWSGEVWDPPGVTCLRSKWMDTSPAFNEDIQKWLVR